MVQRRACQESFASVRRRRDSVGSVGQSLSRAHDHATGARIDSRRATDGKEQAGSNGEHSVTG